MFVFKIFPTDKYIMSKWYKLTTSDKITSEGIENVYDLHKIFVDGVDINKKYFSGKEIDDIFHTTGFYEDDEGEMCFLRHKGDPKVVIITTIGGTKIYEGNYLVLESKETHVIPDGNGNENDYLKLYSDDSRYTYNYFGFNGKFISERFYKFLGDVPGSTSLCGMDANDKWVLISKETGKAITEKYDSFDSNTTKLSRCAVKVGNIGGNLGRVYNYIDANTGEPLFDNWFDYMKEYDINLLPDFASSRSSKTRIIVTVEDVNNKDTIRILNSSLSTIKINIPDGYEINNFGTQRLGRGQIAAVRVQILNTKNGKKKNNFITSGGLVSDRWFDTYITISGTDYVKLTDGNELTIMGANSLGILTDENGGWFKDIVFRDPIEKGIQYILCKNAEGKCNAFVVKSFGVIASNKQYGWILDEWVDDIRISKDPIWKENRTSKGGQSHYALYTKINGENYLLYGEYIIRCDYITGFRDNDYLLVFERNEKFNFLSTFGYNGKERWGYGKLPEDVSAIEDLKFDMKYFRVFFGDDPNTYTCRLVNRESMEFASDFVDDIEVENKSQDERIFKLIVDGKVIKTVEDKK